MSSEPIERPIKEKIIDGLVFTSITLGISLLIFLKFFASPETAILFDSLLAAYFILSILILFGFFKSLKGWKRRYIIASLLVPLSMFTFWALLWLFIGLLSP